MATKNFELRISPFALPTFPKFADRPSPFNRTLAGTATWQCHRFKEPESMKDVYQGAKYVNGVPVNQGPEEKAI